MVETDGTSLFVAKIIWDEADGKGEGCSYSARVKIKVKLAPNMKFLTVPMYDFAAQTQKVEPLMQGLSYMPIFLRMIASEINQ